MSKKGKNQHFSLNTKMLTFATATLAALSLSSFSRSGDVQAAEVTEKANIDSTTSSSVTNTADEKNHSTYVLKTSTKQQAATANSTNDQIAKTNSTGNDAAAANKINQTTGIDERAETSSSAQSQQNNLVNTNHSDQDTAEKGFKETGDLPSGEEDSQKSEDNTKVENDDDSQADMVTSDSGKVESETETLDNNQKENHVVNDQVPTDNQNTNQLKDTKDEETKIAPKQASPSASNKILNGLVSKNGVTYYYKNGVRQAGQQIINGKTYYFDLTSKKMRKNYFLNQNNNVYYFDKNGVRYTNQFYNNWGRTYYFGNQGARYTNQFYKNWGNMYYFGHDGARYTKQFYNNWGRTYYFGEKGIRYTNRFYKNWGNMYYFGHDGARYTNKFYNNWGRTYYFGENGVRYTNKFYQNWGHLYYFGGDGALATNRAVYEKGNRYYTNNKGIITTGNYAIEKAIAAAKSQIGLAPYAWGGGRTPASIAAHRFDCSSFIHWVYARAGINLGNYTGATTWTLRNYGRAVNWNQLKRGDIFMMDHINHVGLYLGGGYFIHDSPNSSTGGVGINQLTDVVNNGSGKWSWASIVDNVNRRLV